MITQQGTSVESAIGDMPNHRSWRFPLWVAAAKKHKLRFLENPSLISYDHTLYIDSVTGDDGDDGSTPALAVAGWSRMHDLVNALPAGESVRVRIARGSEFTGGGKEYTFSTADHDHDCACFFDRTCRVDTYGAGHAPYFHTGDNVADSWTQNTNAWYADATGFGVVGHVYEHDASGTLGNATTVFTKAADLTACEATPRSFWYDSGNTRLYVNTDGTSPGADIWYAPNNYWSALRFESCHAVVDLRGDNNEPALGFGWGIGDSNSHDYFLSSGTSGTYEQIFAYARAYFGSLHLISHWWGTPKGNGIFTVYKCGGGGNLFTATGDAVHNFYQPSGNLEAFAIGCDCEMKARGSDDFPVLVAGHSLGTVNGIIGIIDSDSPGGFTMGNLPGTNGFPDTFTTFVYNCRIGTPTNPAGDGSDVNFIGILCSYINTIFVLSGTPQDTNGWFSVGNDNSAFEPQLLNVIFDLVNSETSGSEGFGLISTGQSGNNDWLALHCAFLYDNEANATKGMGFSGIQADLGTLHFNGTRSKCANSLVINRGSNLVVAAMYNNAQAQQYNCYYNCDEDPAIISAGHNATTSPRDLTFDPVSRVGDVYSIGNFDELDRAPQGLGYDFNGNRRGRTLTAAGPVENPQYAETREIIMRANDLVFGTVTEIEFGTEEAYESDNPTARFKQLGGGRTFAIDGGSLL